MADGSPDSFKEPDITVDSRKLTELNDQKDALLSKVATLKKELQDWRTKLDTQVKTYRAEVGDLRKTLNTEVEGLRAEFMELKTALKQQLELTAGLAAQEVNDAEARLAHLQAQE
ncbi:hypothetical protein Vretimale_12711 [Volvox reticuliferus]|uniref:Uncharacterized protein n=1 Tax=Volvox reticuliferus TaxID=1737510 RepID=A0A8J4G0D6_9CHLO|nr:hypothetical protein Vretifemale_17308 [Volvox reticuliferus]GIL93467.1 hypothetical protein Vretifemale_20864 [Volvox reticuliferus]GIL95923.1 hypothetical protein Vretimale_1836 [Volvox reticuliferus]GIM08714.1 hypothetical protein Vretimale_12711 [Volvox reticuliferus]